TNSDNLNARNLRATILRRLGASAQSVAGATETHALDPLDVWSRYELGGLSGELTSRSEVPESDGAKNAQTQLTLDLAFDYAAAGFWGETKDLLSGYVSKSEQPNPMALY